MRKTSLIVFAVFVFFVSAAGAQSVHLPLDHWAYGFLERMETRGILTHLRDGSRPFTREKVAKTVQELDAYDKRNPDGLSKVEKDFLERLKGEFCDELKGYGVRIQEGEWEPHFYSWWGSPGFIHIDASGGGEVILRDGGAEKEERRIYSPYYGGILRGSLWGVGIYSDNRIFAEWGTRTYVQHYQASQGYPQNVEGDSSRATWDTSDSYIAFGWKGFRFEVGRDNLRWGPSVFGGLMLSGLAPSFDVMTVSADFGAATFTWGHGAIRSDYSHKWISAHRLEFSLSRGIDIGLSEVVVYGERGMEMAYLNPLIPYLIAEHTLGNRDNVGMGLDIDVNRVRNLKLYGELFIDDLFAPWEVFSDYWGNKLAFTLGGTWVDPLNWKDTEVHWEYTRIEPYVFTHQDSVNVYEHYDVGLGHFLQPNSDGIFLRGEHRFSLSLMAALAFCSTRHGQGDQRLPHREEEGLKKRFLSGVVERKRWIRGQIEWEIMRDFRVCTEMARVWAQNLENIQGNHREWNEVALKIRMNW